MIFVATTQHSRCSTLLNTLFSQLGENGSLFAEYYFQLYLELFSIEFWIHQAVVSMKL